MVGNYDGGKGRIFQQLINLIPPHTVYLEPFIGGGSVMLNKRPALMNVGLDRDERVVAAWRQHVGAGDSGVIVKNGEGMSLPGVLAGNGDAAAAAGAAEASPEMAGIARAVWWSLKLREMAWCFFCGDAIEFLAGYEFDGHEFVYLDPPYLLSTRSRQRPLYRYELARADHVRLLRLIRGLPCQVMISGYYSRLYAEELEDWNTAVFTTYARSNEQKEEWVWMNYPEPSRLHDYRYLGEGFRERERIKRKKARWLAKLKKMPVLERRALLAAIEEAF